MGLATWEALVNVGSALVAAYCGLKLCTRKLAPERKSVLSYCCCMALAILFGVGGLLSVTKISRSERPTLDGVIRNLSQTAGKSPGSYFTLERASGRAVALRCRYHESNLSNGEHVRVKTLQDYGEVLDLEVVSGSHYGWQLHEGDDLLLAKFSVFAGGCFALMAFAFWIRRPDSL